jgi:hypothetical protein
MGYVYLLLEVDKDGNERHKIGITRNSVEKRIKQLQTGNSNKIQCLHSFQTEHFFKVEGWLHKKYGFQKTETKNEWFQLTNEQVASFMDDCTEIEKKVIYLLENNSFYK